MTAIPIRICLFALFCFTAPVGSVHAASGDHDMDSLRVRIRILEKQKPHTLVFTSDAPVTAATSRPEGAVLHIPPGVEIGIRAEEGRLVMETLGRSLAAAAVRIERADGGTWKILTGSRSSADEGKVYSGTLKVDISPGSSNVLRLINVVDLETYVAAVVTSEYGLDDLEGSKAMAVVARTYAVKSVGKFGNAYDHVDHTSSQVYDGTRPPTDRAMKAARNTRGEVLKYGNELVEATYFSASGGHTASNEDVWLSARAVPYLRGKPDPAERSPHADWSSRIPHDKLIRALSGSVGFPATGFRITERSADGRARRIAVVGAGGKEKFVSGNDFRMALTRSVGPPSIRSTRFDISREGDVYVFRGSGYGHGVGMSQWGAHSQAQAGKSYREILAYYYPGTRVYKLSSPDVRDAGRELIRRVATP